MHNKLNRRRFIAGSVRLSLGGGALLALAGCGKESADNLLCADPEQMSYADAAVRRTLNYVEVSSDPLKVCAGCEFFYPSTDGGGCGSCEIFSGNAVNPAGHCDSWSKDA